jgi:hypothetical protein
MYLLAFSDRHGGHEGEGRGGKGQERDGTHDGKWIDLNLDANNLYIQVVRGEGMCWVRNGDAEKAQERPPHGSAFCTCVQPVRGDMKALHLH